MKKLIIVGTKADVGKGGISTALTGYIDGLTHHDIEYQFVVSHDGDRNTLVVWVLALVQMLKLAIKYRTNAVFWFHCGPWLSLVRKFTLAIVPRMLGATTVGHIHSPTFNQYINGNVFMRAFVSLVLSPYKTLVALTPWWRTLLHDKGIKKNIIVSPNPNSAHSCSVAQNFLEQPKSVPNHLSPVNILTMARMVEGKGIEVMIEAMSSLPQHYRLTIAGDGNKLTTFKALAQQSKAKERIHFTGWVNGERKDQLLREATLFALPSTYDSFGMVFIEAMAYDLPVLAYGWGPINDVVTDDVGQCCAEVTSQEVVKKIEYLIDHIKDYSGSGPNKVISNYTPEQVAQNIIRLLQ